jgi:hypothetical protein
VVVTTCVVVDPPELVDVMVHVTGLAHPPSASQVKCDVLESQCGAVTLAIAGLAPGASRMNALINAAVAIALAVILMAPPAEDDIENCQ